MVSFNTLSDYLWLLQATAQEMHILGSMALLYLSAAVSDFYIPASQMPCHKIQSSGGPLSLSLQLVPKMLAPLVTIWAPNAFIVSFKLETNEKLLEAKSKESLEKYHHHVSMDYHYKFDLWRIIMSSIFIRLLSEMCWTLVKSMLL